MLELVFALFLTVLTGVSYQREDLFGDMRYVMIIVTVMWWYIVLKGGVIAMMGV